MSLSDCVYFESSKNVLVDRQRERERESQGQSNELLLPLLTRNENNTRKNFAINERQREREMYKHFLHNRLHTHDQSAYASSISSVHIRVQSSILFSSSTLKMALTKGPRFMLVKSTVNAHVTDENMEPYHVSVFRRSRPMAPLPRRPAAATPRQPPSSRLVSKYQRREKDEALTNKLYKLNMHTMRKKSARISMRLSSVFGLSTHTIDERFNFEEQRFRGIDKFLRLFVRNAYTCMEALKVRARSTTDHIAKVADGSVVFI